MTKLFINSQSGVAFKLIGNEMFSCGLNDRFFEECFNYFIEGDTLILEYK